MRLLLDLNVPPSLAAQLQRNGVDAVALRDWRDGRYRTAPDRQLLSAALSERRVLVTYDRRTIPPILREWAGTGQHHAGVVLVHEKTIHPRDVGGLLRALRALIAESGDEDWQDQVIFLPRR